MPAFDKSVLSNLMLRLESVEKKENSTSNESMMRLEKEFKELKEILNKLTESFNEHISNYNNFIKETNDRFADYELAIADLEKDIYHNEEQLNQELEVEEVNEIDNSNDKNILSGDLKKIIKLELDNPN
jgi:hypothetical protein